MTKGHARLGRRWNLIRWWSRNVPCITAAQAHIETLRSESIQEEPSLILRVGDRANVRHRFHVTGSLEFPPDPRLPFFSLLHCHASSNQMSSWEDRDEGPIQGEPRLFCGENPEAQEKNTSEPPNVLLPGFVRAAQLGEPYLSALQIKSNAIS